MMTTANTGKKSAAALAWERECARWRATPAGQASMALKAAAEKAGMWSELARWSVEIDVYEHEGVTFVRCCYDREAEEMEIPFPRKAWARAVEWTKKYAAARGWVCEQSA